MDGHKYEGLLWKNILKEYQNKDCKTFSLQSAYGLLAREGYFFKGRSL